MKAFIKGLTMKNAFQVLTAVIISTLLFAADSLAANRYWTNGGGNNSWNDTANWTDADVPDSDDVAIFDGNTNSAACAIDANASVAGILITNGYSGIITQNVGRTITIGTSHYKQYDGTFAGGDAGMTLNGDFYLSAGAFNAGSQTILKTGGTWSYSGGTFDAQTSTMNFRANYSTAHTITGSHTLHNVIFANTEGTAGTINIAPGTVLTASETLTFGVPGRHLNFSGGTIAAQGDIVLNSGNYIGSSTLLLINGSGTQTFTGYANTTTSQILPIEINKTTGTLYLAGTIRTQNNWTYTASGGTLDAGTSTIYFHSTYGASYAITGSHTLHNVNFGITGGAHNGTITIASGTTLTTSGTLTLAGTTDKTLTLNTGTLSAQGNVTVGTAGTLFNGTAALQFTGTGDQIFTSSAQYALSGTVTINKGSGTVTLAANAAFNADLVWTAGGLNLSTHTLTVNDNVTIGSGAGTRTLTVAVTSSTTFGKLVVGDDLTGIANAGLVVDFTGADETVIGPEYEIVTNDLDLSLQSFVPESSVGMYTAEVTYGNAFVKLTNVRSAAHPGTVIMFR